jgi:hypothetical protein
MQDPWTAAPPGGLPVAPAPGAPAAAPVAPPALSALDAVRFVFRSPDWMHNVLMGLLFMLIPIAGPIVFAGFLCELHQRLVRRHPQPVPRLDFSDFGHYLSRGVAPFIVSLVVVMPVLLVSYALIGGAAFAGYMIAQTTEPVFGVLVGAGGGLVAVLLWMVTSIFMNGAQTRAELTEDFGQSLSLSELMAYARSTWKAVLVKTITFGFLAFGIVLLGLLACYFGLYPAIVILQIAAMHLRWQIYENHVARNGVPIAVKAPVWLPSEARRYSPYGAY